MSVPNTNTFSLTDVGTEIGLTAPYSLQDCFNNAIASGFDPNYEGSKNSLYNFRNYSHVTPAILGYLYNSYAYWNANFAPAGWHVPTPSDLTVLGEFLDPSGTWQDNVAGSKMKEAGTDFWYTNSDGTNLSGFTGRGAGKRVSTTGYFVQKGFYMIFPSSGDSGSSVIAGHLLYSATRFIYYKLGGGFAESAYNDGIPVRLIKDNSINPGTVADYDGNVYDCVTIGSQVWTVQNWKCTRLNNGTLIPTVTDNNAWVNLTTPGKCAYNNDENNV